MNLIGNFCIPAFLYRDYFKVNYQNPLMWTTIDPMNMRILIQEYDSIDFSKYEIDLIHNNKGDDITGIKSPIVRFDNKFDAVYCHYFTHSPKHSNNPTIKNGVNVFSNEIVDYTKNHIDSRVKRMKEAGSPIFIINAPLYNTRKWNKKVITELMQIPSDYKFVYQVPDDYYNLGMKTHEQNKLVLWRESRKTNLLQDIDSMWKTFEFQQFINS